MSRMLLTLEDVRQAARRRLPRTVFDVVDGGGADEGTVARNREGFANVALRPKALADTSVRDSSTTLFGQRISLPVLFDPCGFQRLAHGEGELAVARAAAAADTIMVLSSATGNPLEDVARAAGGPKWFQLYPPAERTACVELIDRAAAAGFKALVVTIDTGVLGLRERDKRNRLTAPLKVTPRLLAQGAARPRWALEFLRGTTGRGTLGIAPGPGGARRNLHAFRSMKDAERQVAQAARPVTAADLELIRSRWDGPLVVKGVQRGDGATS